MTHKWSKNSGRRSQPKGKRRRKPAQKSGEAVSTGAYGGSHDDMRQQLAEDFQKALDTSVDHGLTQHEAEEEHPNLLVN